ncbi:MAG: hypothetical protein P1S60_20670, partial [Anaerolineae bacterium]|nr:hypothetical protein [Anaerolineae bacterium]
MAVEFSSTGRAYEIAHGIDHYIHQLPSPIRHLMLRPLDISKPRQSSWWLIPGSERTPYRYSKLFIHRQPLYTKDILAGISFDRGLGGQLDGLVDGSLVMQSNWYWRRFLNDLVAGLYNRPVQILQHASQRAPILLIELYAYHRLHKTAWGSRIPDDIVVFAVPGNASSLQLKRQGAD